MGETFKFNYIPAFEPCQSGQFISSGTWIHPRSVRNTYELILVAEGCLRIFEDKKKFNVESGETLLLHPGKVHGGIVETDKPVSFYWLHFKLLNQDNHLCSTIDVEQHCRKSDRKKIEPLFQEYISAQQNRILSPLLGEIILLQIFMYLSEKETPYKPFHPVADQIARYIAEHFLEPISTSNIAEELGRNASYLGRCYKHTYGTNITDAINHHRILRSKRMLTESNLNIDEIALECGFNDPNYFRRVFKHSLGISPRIYRKRYSRIYINTS
jgi:AraC-like DNA-binding protein